MASDSIKAAEDKAVAIHSDTHILQTPQWGQFKNSFGWQAVNLTKDGASAQILFKRLPLGLSIAYLPKGPLGNNWQELWPAVDALCKQNRAIFLQVEPDLFEPLPENFVQTCLAGFVTEPETIQPRRTIVVDLQPDEDLLLAAMKQKTRYNIRLAKKHGVEVRTSTDIATFHRLSETTGNRDGFYIHPLAYYQKAHELFAPQGECVLLEAVHNGTVLAGLMLFLKGKRSWYFYGASDDTSRNLMPTYLLQWEAMCYAKNQGCTSYDLWGIPDEDEAKLEAEFMQRKDGLWGVYRFKRGFGGQVRRSAPAFLRIYRPLWYQAYLLYRQQRKAGSNAPA